ncbi:MAG: Trk system potassium transporter TrkA [Clostridiales bacterium]|nr:Trk system potassium transporter TrkA [Clostridiales bacterium]
MNIVLVGASMIGRAVTSELLKENHDLVVIEKDLVKANRLSDNFDVLVINGSGTDLEVLKEAKVDIADLFISLTSDDQVNILCCMLAKRLGAKSTIARVRNPENEDVLTFLKDDLALSMVVNPELDFAKAVARVLQFPSAISVETFSHNVELMEFKIPEESKLNGLSLMDLNKKYSLNVLISAILRGEEVFIPKGDFILKAEDKIHLTGELQMVQRFVKQFGLFTQKIKKVMIVGGNTDGYYLAKNLLDLGLTVKLIEEKKDRAEELCALLPYASVINCNSADTDMLIEEGIETVDAVVSLSGNDDTNTMISLFAKKLGVKKIITRIDKKVIKTVMEEMGLDMVISPKDVTANSILKYVRSKSSASQRGVINLYKIIADKVEATEFLVLDDYEFLNKKLKTIKIRKDVIIGAIIKKGEVVIPSGDIVIEKNDKVIIVTTAKLKELGEIIA